MGFMLAIALAFLLGLHLSRRKKKKRKSPKRCPLLSKRAREKGRKEPRFG
jgi:hypothetical protein